MTANVIEFYVRVIKCAACSGTGENCDVCGRTGSFYWACGQTFPYSPSGEKQARAATWVKERT